MSKIKKKIIIAASVEMWWKERIWSNPSLMLYQISQFKLLVMNSQDQIYDKVNNTSQNPSHMLYQHEWPISALEPPSSVWYWLLRLKQNVIRILPCIILYVYWWIMSEKSGKIYNVCPILNMVSYGLYCAHTNLF